MALGISIIVPLYNEQAVFDTLIERLVKVIDTTFISLSSLVFLSGNVAFSNQLINIMRRTGIIWVI